MKLTFGPNWMRSPLGIVSSRLSSNTEFSDSTHSGSMSPSQITHERTSGGSRTTLRADAVSTPSNHSRVSISMWPRSCSRGVRVRVSVGWGVWGVGSAAGPSCAGSRACSRGIDFGFITYVGIFWPSLSRAALSICQIVDLPQPDGPTMTTPIRCCVAS